ncbi:hypothetical protein [Azospirillum sp. BE72]|uniref:hypothetical protein n=1 Tax=Azospirillum sp. BE72 TaxID=2817776 RepID=UPI002857029F|nr:hypothetical protein [Azospirillum sp. BE72]MDR6770355.1 hypothetical protein [Azospirillum sp. BE72]
MSRATLKVVFDGPAIRNGSMDVRDLAPALLAVGKLCEEANRVLNEKKTEVTVLVKSDFEAGSFHVNLDVVQSLLEQMKSLLTGDNATAAANLITFLGFAGGSGIGLLKLLKKLRGRQPRRWIVLEDGNVRLELGDDAIDVPREVVDLYRDLDTRKAVADLMRPLEKEGIDTIAFSSDDSPVETVTRDDAVSFTVVPEAPEEQIVSEERNAFFSIVAVTFKDGNKWRLSDGQNTIGVTMADEEFLGRVNRNEVAFAKGDILHCRLLTEQWRTADSLRTEYTVLKVLDYRSAARQLPLPFSGPSPTAGE